MQMINWATKGACSKSITSNNPTGSCALASRGFDNDVYSVFQHSHKRTLKQSFSLTVSPAVKWDIGERDRGEKREGKIWKQTSQPKHSLDDSAEMWLNSSDETGHGFISFQHKDALWMELKVTLWDHAHDMDTALRYTHLTNECVAVFSSSLLCVKWARSKALRSYGLAV